MNRTMHLHLTAVLLTFAAAASPQDPQEKAEPEGLPLEPATVIEFETSEGTWMSLDVSPDGSTIVFDLLGDLYALPIGGGEARRIAGDMSFESQPKFSPDGATIAFLSDRSGVENLWLMDADGSNPRAVSTDEPTKDRPQAMASPSWTPDGDYLLVSKSRPPERTYAVFMYHRDGGTGVRVGSAPPPDEPGGGGNRPQPPNRLGAVASPDGRFIYYAERQGSFNYNAEFPIWQIVRFDRDTGETATITNAPGSAMRPLLSPDGKHLVYGTRFRTETGLRIRDLETGTERWLAPRVTRDDQESRATRDTLPGYAFLPDGQSILLTIDGKIHRLDVASGRSAEVPFTAQIATEIAPRLHYEGRVDDSPTVAARLLRSPSLSPDGRRIAFGAFNRVWVADVSAEAGTVSTPTRLTSQNTGEFMPAWSPDGNHIAFVTWSVGGGHIYRMAADGSGSPERLTDYAAFYADPVYTPGGDRIVFITGTAEDQLYAFLSETHDTYGDDGEISGVRRTGTTDLRYIPADGGTSTFIAANEGGRYPHFADDPERVFTTTSSGLVSVRLDGHDRRTHLKVKGVGPGANPPVADAMTMAPDGESALVSVQNQLYLVAIPRAGESPLELTIGAGDTPVPVTDVSEEGGNDLAWTRDGSAVVWAQGARVYRRDVPLEPDDEEETVRFDIRVEVPRPKPSGTVVLQNAARVITMRGDEIIASGDVVVTDNRITAVGSDLDVPPGAEVIDVSGKTVMPGIVDAHAHMWAPRGLHQTEVWQYLANLAYGVTTTRDPQTSTDDVFAYADLVEAGEILGPRIFATGPGIFSTSGVSSAEAAEHILSRYREDYDARTIKQYVVGDRIVRQWVALAARKYELTPTTEGALDLKLDLTQMTDGYSGHEHSLPIVPLYEDVARFVAETETYYTPTILVAYGGPWTENYFFQNTDVAQDEKLQRYIPYQLLDNMTRRRGQWFLPEEYIHTKIAEGARKIVRAGGKVCLGSHGQLQGIGAHWETWAIHSGGLTEHETLRAITMCGAEAIGLSADVGSIEVGKLADILVLDGNPLEDIEQTNTVRYVMKNGEVYEAATLDQIWPERKPLPPQFWWDDLPESTEGPGAER